MRVILLLTSVLSLLLPLSGQTTTPPPLPEETLHWDTQDLEQSNGAVWTTAGFPTLPGALYTL